MSFNFAELQQKADRVLFNADQFIRRYVDFALAPAQDITIQYYDQNGNLQTFTVPNRQKLVNQLYADLPNSMVRTFYVDQVNGNDNNSGTYQQPFKSLQRAIDGVPTGGIGYIHLMSDFTLDSHVSIRHKTIYLYLNGKTLSTVYYGTHAGHSLKYCIILDGANLYVHFPGRIIIPPVPPGYPQSLAPTTYSFIGSGHPLAVTSTNPAFLNSVVFYIYHNTDSEYTFLEVYSGSLAGYHQWDNGATSLIHIGFVTHHNVTAIIANNAYLIQTYGRPFVIGISFENRGGGGFLKRPDGTVITNFADVIAGIVRDVNGVPRNIIANKTL